MRRNAGMRRLAQFDDEYDYIDLSGEARQYAYEQWYLSEESSWLAEDATDEDLQSAEFFFDSIGCNVKGYEIDNLAGPSFYYVDMRDSTYWGLDCTDGDLVEIPEGLSDGLWMAEGLLYKWQTEYRPQLVSLAMEAFQHANGGTATDEEMEDYYDELIYRYEKFVSELADMTANDIGEDRAWHYSEEAFEDIAMGNDFKFDYQGFRIR